MPANPLSEEMLQQAVDAVKQHGSVTSAALALGISRPTFQHRYLEAQRRGMAAPEGFKIKGTSTLYNTQTGEAMLQWVKTSEDQEAQDAKLRAIVEGLKGDLPIYKKGGKPEVKTPAEYLNLIPWGDPHFGLLCWDKEVGEDFDLEIAERDLCAAVDNLVDHAPPAERCVIANLGDFFHIDNLDGVTPANKHSLDQDSRLPKVIKVGVRAYRRAVESAKRRHKIVELVNSRANHDPVLGLALSILLAHVYENDPRVIVHEQPTFRHYVRHGKVLIGFVHGDKTKDRDLPGIMATERAKDWGETKHRYFFRGHHHHDHLDEFNGCKVEQVRTLAPGDAYANGGGWLSGRDMKLITYHAEHGERARITCGIDLLRSLQ